MSRLADNVGIAWGSLWARPGRAVGLIVPVAVGVATIVASFGASASARQDVVDDLAALGSDQVHVQAGAGAEDRKLPAEAAGRARLLPGARVVSARAEQPDRRVRASVAADPLAPLSASAVVTAADPRLPAAVGAELAAGRFLDAGDDTRAADVVVLGAALARAFGVDRVVDATVLVDDRPFAVVGVLAPVPSDPTLNRSALVPFATAARRWGDDGRPTELVVLTDADQATVTADALPTLVTFGAGPRPTARSASELVAAHRQVDDTLNLLAAATGGLALLLGASAVAAALGASVLTRTGEIGIRRALGATRRDVTVQFLLEAGILGSTAAIIGAVAGPAVVAAIAHRQAWPTAVDWWLVGATTALAVELTVIAALLPARHAASFDPLTALRT